MIKEYTFYATGNEEVHVEWQHPNGEILVTLIPSFNRPKPFNLDNAITEAVKQINEKYGESIDLCIVKCFWDNGKSGAVILPGKEIKRVYPNKNLTK